MPEKRWVGSAFPPDSFSDFQISKLLLGASLHCAIVHPNQIYTHRTLLSIFTSQRAHQYNKYKCRLVLSSVMSWQSGMLKKNLWYLKILLYRRSVQQKLNMFLLYAGNKARTFLLSSFLLLKQIEIKTLSHSHSY